MNNLAQILLKTKALTISEDIVVFIPQAVLSNVWGVANGFVALVVMPPLHISSIILSVPGTRKFNYILFLPSAILSWNATIVAQKMYFCLGLSLQSLILLLSSYAVNHVHLLHPQKI